MTSNELEPLDVHAENLTQIAELWNKNQRNITAIAKTMKMSRAEVLRYVDEYKEIIRNDEEVKARAREALYEADEALHHVNKENWDIVNNSTDDKVKSTVLKNIGDLEVKRVEMLQKAGLYDDAALGDELAAMEEKQQILIEILKDVTAHCPNCKYEVARRLSRVTGKAEPVVIDAEVIEPAR